MLKFLLITKRKRFVVTSLLLSIGFILINLTSHENKILYVFLLTFFTLLMFIWNLWEGLFFNATLLSLVLPPLFTLGVGLFWFLIPTTIYARLPVIALYGFGIYALCLTANIFTVSAIRTIALVRAARGVGFVLTLLVAFLLFDAIFSMKLNIMLHTSLIFAVSLPLLLQSLWTCKLDTNIIKDECLIYSFVFALITSQIATILYTWPVTVVVGSLFLTVTMYSVLGLGQAKLEERLFKNVLWEYLSVSIIVFIAILASTRWG